MLCFYHTANDSDGKESACTVGHLGSVPGLGKSPGEGMATHSRILAWRIPRDRGAWRATDHGVTKSWTQLSDQADIYIFSLLSHTGQHRALSRISCTMYVLTSYLFYSEYQHCICVNPSLPIPPATPLSPLVSIYLFSTSVSLFLLANKAIWTTLLDSTYIY